MRIPSSLGFGAATSVSCVGLWAASALLGLVARAVTFDPVPDAALDLANLGRVGIVGDFNAISLYRYRQQNQNTFSTNGSQAILTPLPNGAYASLVSADAYIQAMCPFVMKGGQLAGVVVGGNFTSLAGVEAQGIALYNVTSNKVTPLPGLSGKVSALLCDEATNMVYVGGEFRGANSTNALAWVGLTGWSNLPFAGFNGPVNSIAKAADGKIIFGGSFTGLGNFTGPAERDQQVVNLGSARISGGSSTTRSGYDDPRNVVCNSRGQDAPGNTWLLADKSPGYWRAEFRFGFRPTKLRIWNTRHEGRGTKTFRFTALPINGIMNLTYTDPATGRNATCDARCPLLSDSKSQYQDFTFVNVIGMSAFQIDITEWYGLGAGFNGIELFQDDIYAFAVKDFNEPTCANIDTPSTSTATGPWSVVPSQQSSSDYLSGSFSGTTISSASPPSVRFEPDVRESGNYSVTIYTPGCRQDNTCQSRGRVNVTVNVATGTRASGPIQTEIYQTNYYDKYDEIYNGYVDASSGSFRPSVTLTPSSDQLTDGGNVTIVAQRVRFELTSSTGGLNGLYEYDPSKPVVQTDFANSTIARAGLELKSGAAVTNVIVHEGVTYVAGNLSSGAVDNIFQIRDGNSAALVGGGLNGHVIALYRADRILYAGGTFNDTSKSATRGLNNVAAYSISDRSWQPLGNGVNGRVEEIVPLTLNITAAKPETVISLTGAFDELLQFDGKPAVPVSGFAIWVPSKRDWLQNLDADIISIDGQLTTAINVPGGGGAGTPLLAGTLSSQGLSAQGAVTIPVNGPLSLNPVPLKIIPSRPTTNTNRRRRAGQEMNVTGVVTGYFYESGGRNVTILGGRFTARGTNGSNVNNLAFVNGTNSNAVTGLGPGLSADSAFLALAVHQDTLFAGGRVEGSVGDERVNGLVLYDLARANYVRPQPAAFAGADVVVNAIATRPNTADVYVGGNFESAGSLPCPSICIFTTTESQWNRPGDGLTGSIGTMAWAGSSRLVVGGNLTVNGTAASIATYDAKARQWSAFLGGQNVPGPVTALSAADVEANRFWIAGASTNGSAFLMVYDGRGFQSVGDTLGKTTRIRGLQVLSLSKQHDRSALLDANQVLLVTGQLDLPGFGNASAALFNGTTFTPFLLATSANNGPGSLSQFVSLKRDFFRTSRGHLAVGFVVLIALAISLALIFLLVVAGILAERLQRKREHYLPAPTQIYDKSTNIERVPPSHLFGSLGPHGRGPTSAPTI